MNKELYDEILTIAQATRTWTEEQKSFRKCPPNDLYGYCAISSAYLWQCLHKKDIEAKIHMWDGPEGFHMFVVVEDHIVDVTATQFGYHKQVEIMHVKEAEVFDWWNSDRIFETAEELKKFQIKKRHNRMQVAYEKYLRYVK